jgi:hypothetical protein
MSKSSTLANRRNAEQIPPDRWIPFLAQFTKENRGAHARLEIIGPDVETGYQVETADRPFDGVSSDTKDREREVWIAFGSTADDHLTHGVPCTTAIRVLPADETTGAVLEVEAADGTKTVLELTRPEDYALPPTGRRNPN